MAEDKKAETTQAAASPAARAGAVDEAQVSRGAVLGRRWMDENLAGGPVARNVEMWNAVHDALPALAVLIDAG